MTERCSEVCVVVIGDQRESERLSGGTLDVDVSMARVDGQIELAEECLSQRGERRVLIAGGDETLTRSPGISSPVL